MEDNTVAARQTEELIDVQNRTGILCLQVMAALTDRDLRLLH